MSDFASMPPDSKSVPPPDATAALGPDALSMVRGAMELLEFVVATGYKPASGQLLSSDIALAIKAVAAAVDLPGFHVPHLPPEAAPNVPLTEWLAFELAYHRLAQFTCPITAESLRNTADTGGFVFSKRQAPAQAFTRLLWLVALSLAAFAVGSEWGQVHYGPVQDGIVDMPNAVMQLIQILQPYAYGGLGSCVYLLRSGHRFIYERSFDLRRRPEYFNRIILGTIGGGAIILLVDHLTDDNGQVIKLSAAALGFIAGYSTDFLFNAIERLVNAVLPKVGFDSVRRAPSATKPTLEIDGSSMSLNDLFDRFERSTSDQEKALYKSLIERVRDRM